jgi:hyperosmotically inducible protein
MQSFTLRGTTVAAILTFAMIGGCATARDRAEVDEDKMLMRQIEGELFRNDYVSSMEVDVDVLDNVATLRGDVIDERARREAGAEAAAVPGVVRVENQLVVIGANREAYVDEDPDRRLTMRIRRNLRASGAVKSRDLDVDVFDGEVYLSGVVETERERLAAASLAGDEPGVDAVHNEIKVAGER